MSLRPPSQELRLTVRVVNAQGLHARPCHAIVTRALARDSDLRIRSRDREVNGKSILELMTLSAGPGTELELVARGADAEALLADLAQLFEGCFGEERDRPA
ncbi:MAG TPA: HPr family phosphocarrier protein [Planctomycetota bacterium]